MIDGQLELDYSRRDYRPMSNVELVKLCPRCRSAKTYDRFYRSKKSKDGCSSYCRVCVRELSVERKERGGVKASTVVAKQRLEREQAKRGSWNAVDRTAPTSLADFERFCSCLTLEFGGPLEVEDFERELLRDYFDGVVETVVILPKKNGKTTLLGALALYHLARTPGAECVIGAASRDQATILFNQAAGLVKRSELASEFDVLPGYREIRLADDRLGRVRVLASDANTADGVIPTLALVDELHRHPSGELYGVFRDGLGPRDGQMITISTAGANLDSPLGVLRATALEIEGFARDAETAHSCARSANGAFVLHEWSLTASDDPNDMDLVKRANPASWQTVEQLTRRHDSPSTTPWQWLRFACGVWTEGEEPWILPAKWDVLAEPDRPMPDAVFLGVDLGVRHDSSAIVAAGVDDDGRLVVRADIMRPQGTLPVADVEQRIREVAARYGRVLGVVYDPWSFRRSAELLEADGLLMLEFPQSQERMSLASAALYRVIDAGVLAHDGSQDLRSHVLSGHVQETERGWRLRKDPTSRRQIDALIALAMSAQVATMSDRSVEPMIAFV